MLAGSVDGAMRAVGVRLWIDSGRPTSLVGRLMPAPPRLPLHYGRCTRAILLAAIAVIRPRHGDFDKDLDQKVLAAVLTFIPYMQPVARYGFPLGLWALELAPVFFGYGFVRMSRLPLHSRYAYLLRWENSFGPFRTMWDGLRALALMCFYQQPEVQAVLEIEWQRRADELVDRRARLQRMAPELANPRNAARTRR